MKVELNQQPKTNIPTGFDEMNIRDKLIEIQLLITSLNIMFREVREQIEKNDNNPSKTNFNQ